MNIACSFLSPYVVNEQKIFAQKKHRDTIDTIIMMFFEKINKHILFVCLALIGVAVSFLRIAFAAAPNPGHNYSEIGGGTVQGDLIYSNATDTLAVLSKSTTTSRYLSNGGLNNNPTWSLINLANGVTGNLATTSLNGGTGASSTTFWRGDGTWSDPLYKHISTAPADVATAGAANSITSCTGLSFPVTNGVTYRFSAQINYTSSAANNGSRWTITGPTTSQLSYTSTYALSATTLTTNNAVAYGIPAASSASSANTTGNIAQIQGVLVPTANGTVTVQFASELGAPSNITCKAGSTIEYW